MFKYNTMIFLLAPDIGRIFFGLNEVRFTVVQLTADQIDQNANENNGIVGIGQTNYRSLLWQV